MNSLYSHCRVCRTVAIFPVLTQPKHILYYFPPFGRWVARRSFSFSKASLAWDGRKRGFPDKYARSETRGRFVGKRHSRLTLKPTESPMRTSPL